MGESLGFERRHGREVFRDGTKVAGYRKKTKLGFGWEGMWHQKEDARGAPEKCICKQRERYGGMHMKP